MARNRQRAKDRKQAKQPDGDAGRLDDGAFEIVGPSLAQGAPPSDLGTSAPPVDFDDEDGRLQPDEDVDDVVGPGAGDLAAPPVKRRSIFGISAFLRACWAELQRVQWPDRRQVGQATAVVLGFVVIAGAFLGAMDVVAQKLVDFIL